MLNSKLKLYAVLLGGRAKGCHIELHDVQFTVADKIENAYLDIREKWFGLKNKVHIDSYIHLDVVDGFEVVLSKEPLENQKEKLFFINLGAYENGKFSELHEMRFFVDQKEFTVKKRAKDSLLQGKLSVHTDDLYDVDDCISIKKVGGYYIKLVPTSKYSELTPVNGYHPLPKSILNS